MISGRQTLDSITRALAEERAKAQEVDRRLAQASERLVAIDVERSKATAELARLRLGHISSGGAGRLQGADAKVAEMLAQRARARQDLEGIHEAVSARLERLESGRGALADALEAASDRVDTLEAEVQERLERDEAYRAQRDVAVEAERTARHADDKARESEAERAAKGRAFESDPIFVYLWRRGYGTSAYRAGPLTRALDRWAAGLIRFDAARPNYARLVDLPVRLREHADAVDAQAQEAYLELKRLDEQARRDGGVVELEAEREAAREALERHDQEVAEVARERQETFERLERIDRGEDEDYAKALAFLGSELGREDVQALRRQALATPFPEDDVVVGRLLDLETERSRLRSSLDELKGVPLRHPLELGPGTSFPDRDLVTTMIAQFLLGAATRDALWRVFEQQRRVDPGRSNPTFGSGGFGKGSPWSGGRGWPGAGTSGGGFGGGGSRTGGSFGGGGFRTGGRIGGGGFRTGGKF